MQKTKYELVCQTSHALAISLPVARVRSFAPHRAMPTAASSTTLIVTTSTGGYAHWLRHLHRNLVLLGREQQLRVCAADESAADLAEQLGVVAMTPNSTAHHDRHHRGRTSGGKNTTTHTVTRLGRALTAHQPRTGLTFGSAAWAHAVHFKQRCVWSMLESSAHDTAILLIDGDVTLFRDPLPVLLHEAALHAYDVAALDDTRPWEGDGQRYLNSGFVFMRNTAATRSFGRAYLAALERRRGINDQTVFNDVLHCHSPSSGVRRPADKDLVHYNKCPGHTNRAPGGPPGLRVRALDQRRFLCGFLFYEYRRRRPLNATAAVAVHHNWIRGDRNKWERAVAYDTVITDANEPLRRFLRRARSSMTGMQEWQYRNRSHPGNHPI